MKYPQEGDLQGPEGRVSYSRNRDGVPVIHGKTWNDCAYGLGWCHARDRFTDTVLLSVIGQGRSAENILNLPHFVTIDRIFRRMNLWQLVNDELKGAGPEYAETISLLAAYSAGFNEYRRRRFRPWELVLLGFNPPAWSVAHSMLVGKVMGYLGLAQGQEEVERFIVEAVQRGSDPVRLADLFSPHLKGMDVELLLKVQLEHLSPIAMKTPPRMVPLVGGSNNWVVGPKRSASGNALLCSDPHLEINRLPPVWYEVQMICDSETLSGVTFPGVPGVLIGRNSHVSFGVTYTMADTTDFWVHECRGGRVRIDGTWRDLRGRREVIGRRRSKPLLVSYYELPDGSVLDSEPIRDGYYLSLGWSGRHRSALDTMQRMSAMNRSRTVKEAMNFVGGMGFPALNWLFADDSGSIGFQVGGSYPRRATGWSGLYPAVGWDSSMWWQGFLSGEELPSEYNPKRGYITTANNDVNQKGKPVIVNLPLPSWRTERIAEILESGRQHTIEDMRNLQLDLYSKQAERLFPLIEPYLDATVNADYLRGWDFTYDTKSYAPTVFENVYREIILSVFGDGGLGRPWLRELAETTPLTETIVYHIERILLGKKSVWFTADQKKEIFERAVRRSLNRFVGQWGKKNSLMMNNIVFDGRLPSWLGFDVGPIEVPGGRSTVCQGNIFSIWGRTTSFAPSWRFITDMGRQEYWAAIPGGFSGRPRSPWYLADLQRYLLGHLRRQNLTP